MIIARADEDVKKPSRSGVHGCWGAWVLGGPIFICHKEESKHKLLDLFDRLRAGEDEILSSQKEDTWFYIRSVRDPEGNLLGYYEQLHPPQR